MDKWYARPVLFVADVDAACAFYVDTLGFERTFRHAEGDGPVLVAQLDRGGCEILLTSQWSDKVGQGMLFIALTTEGWMSLRADLQSRGGAFSEGWWGYRCLIVADTDGNALYFPDPDDMGQA